MHGSRGTARHKRVILAEFIAGLAGVDAGQELRRYSVLQLWILVPLSLVAMTTLGRKPALDQLRRTGPRYAGQPGTPARTQGVTRPRHPATQRDLTSGSLRFARYGI
jgi:hypothetical protein